MTVSDNDFIHAILSVKVQLSREHEHYECTVNTLRAITVLQGRFSQPVSVLALYRNAASLVA